MSRNGSGVYSLPAGSTVANGDLSDATDINSPLADIETDLNTPRPVVAGGTGASTAADARTNLGLAIGTNVQAYDAGLQSIAGLTTAADKMIYTTASDTYAVTDLTAAGRALLDDANAAAQRTTLGLVIGTNVQAYDAALSSLAGLSLAQGDILYATAADTLARLPKGTAKQTLLMNAGATAPEWADAQIGVGQTWQNVSASRARNTSYQNTTGRSIMVSVTYNGGTSTAFQASVDNATWVTVSNAMNINAAQRLFATAIIPPDHYYRITDGSTGSVETWAELR